MGLCTDLAAAIEIGRAAVTMLRDWPQPLREALRSMAAATLERFYYPSESGELKT
jgi:hypothetical protein